MFFIVNYKSSKTQFYFHIHTTLLHIPLITLINSIKEI